jgi:hypothetical protein
MYPWLRVRFYTTAHDYRPVNWPPIGPYWCTGYASDEEYVLVAYVKNEEQVYEFWPEATNLDVEGVSEISFTGRFPKPEWWKEEE